jgi:purine nucleoside permease
LIALTATILCAGAVAAKPTPAKITVRVVVVTTFEIGQDTGDTPGEFQTWVERLPLSQTLPFPNGMRALRYNPKKHVLGIVTGSGSVNSAASIMALGLDPRFDLTHAYWLVAGIAGINPHQGSVGSAAWARWVVDRDLSHEIDAREIPKDWTTGVTPLNRGRPYEAPPPAPGIYSPNAYPLNAALTDWAYRLTKDVTLDDTADLKAIRARYPDDPQAMTPPRVLRGDEVSGMNWWLGARMNTIAEDWMAYWTGGQGVSTTTAMEDSGVIRSLQLLQQSGRVDASRVMVLRTASNYSVPGAGQTPAELLAAEEGHAGLSAYLPALEAAYRVGSRVVDALSGGWARYRDKAP